MDDVCTNLVDNLYSLSPIGKRFYARYLLEQPFVDSAELNAMDDHSRAAFLREFVTVANRDDMGFELAEPPADLVHPPLDSRPFGWWYRMNGGRDHDDFSHFRCSGRDDIGIKIDPPPAR